MKGDGQSKGLINAWLSSPFAKVRRCALEAQSPSRAAGFFSFDAAGTRPLRARAQSVFKNRLDSGMAQSIFESERRLSSMAVEQYSHMKKLKQKLEWGYKIVDNEVMCTPRPVAEPPRAAPPSRRPARARSPPGVPELWLRRHSALAACDAPFPTSPPTWPCRRRAKEAAGEIEKQTIVPVTRDMIAVGVLDQAKKALNL
jgi:hypothetical protein